MATKTTKSDKPAPPKTGNRRFPPHEPTRVTRELVQLHTVMGTEQELIARIVGITSKTLRAHYREELDLGMARANATIGGALFNKAKNGDTTAMIFWLKTRAGWREVNRHEVTGADNRPIEIIRTVIDVDGSKIDIPGVTTSDKRTAH